MSSSFRLALPLALASLVLGGAGCLSLDVSGTKTAAGDGGMFRSTDAGVTWTGIAAVPSATGVGSMTGTNVLALARDPQDLQTMYVGTRENGLFYTIDSGATWQRPRMEALRDGAVSAVAVDPKATCTMYATKAARVYKTTDCLRTFTADLFVESRPAVTISAMQVDWYNTQTLWLAESNGDVQKSEDGGKTWRRSLSLQGSATSIAVNKSDSRVVVVGTSSKGFYRTGDGGATWTQVFSQLKDLSGAGTVFALDQDAKGTVLIAATKYGLIRSRDFGGAWETVQLLTTPGQVEIHALAVGPVSADVIAYATAGTFYRSLDGGKNWTTRQLTSGRIPTVLSNDAKNPLMYFIGFAAPLEK